MAEFILIDLQTQMPYLPAYMRTWPRERFLDWLRLYGEVYHPEHMKDRYTFRSWSGRWTYFDYLESGELFIPDTRVGAWEHALPPS
jgi:hypothetical protein